MKLKDINIGLGITGSLCNISKMYDIIDMLKHEGANVIPIITKTVATENSRFGKAKEIKEKIILLTGNKLIDSLAKAEPIGPKNMIDIMLIAPCTGNTLAKFANGITDTPVLMATKSHIRNNKPVVIAISSNDALGVNAKNIGTLLETKNIYFVPFSQDDYNNKPKSLVFEEKYILDTILSALSGKQIQPLLAK